MLATYSGLGTTRALLSRGLAVTSLALSFLAMFLTTEQALGQSRFDQGIARDRTMSPLLGGAQSGGWQGNSWLNTTMNQPADWRLGVRVDPVETGVLVREVTPGSAGARARLEVGDLIIAVGGYQVGIIDGRLFELAEELRRRADSTGAVSILVQDHNNGQIANVHVQLDASQTALTGELYYRERLPLPSDAVVTVQIDNLTRPYAAVRGGQTSFRPLAGSTIPFEIGYDPAYISPDDVYQVRAVITSGGRAILDTPQPPRVITQGNPSRVTLNLAPVSTALVSNPGAAVVTAGYGNYNAVNDQLVTLYRQYLGRNPTNGELAALQFSPNIQSRLATLPIELMGAQEYFDAAGNNNQLWLTKVFTTIVGKQPTQAEYDQWNRRFADLRYSRTELLRQLYTVAPRR